MTRWFAIASLALLAGCALEKGVYDPRRFADWPIDPAKKVSGCATVVTTPGQDASVWRGGPTGFTGSAITLEVPLGTITREAALRVFGDLFRDGASHAAAPGTGACRIELSPRATRLTWTAHVFGAPTFHVWVSVEAKDPAGATLLAKEYASGPYEVREPTAHERVSIGRLAWAAQVAVQAIMLDAAADLKKALEPSARADPGGGAGANRKHPTRASGIRWLAVTAPRTSRP